MSPMRHVRLQALAIEGIVLTMSLTPAVWVTAVLGSRVPGLVGLVLHVVMWALCVHLAKVVKHWYYKKEMARVFRPD